MMPAKGNSNTPFSSAACSASNFIRPRLKHQSRQNRQHRRAPAMNGLQRAVSNDRLALELDAARIFADGANGKQGQTRKRMPVKVPSDQHQKHHAFCFGRSGAVSFKAQRKRVNTIANRRLILATDNRAPCAVRISPLSNMHDKAYNESPPAVISK